nr:hypothetical protein Iba_chr06bCG11340 [Ipomoea batatas]
MPPSSSSHDVVIVVVVTHRRRRRRRPPKPPASSNTAARNGSLRRRTRVRHPTPLPHTTGREGYRCRYPDRRRGMKPRIVETVIATDCSRRRGRRKGKDRRPAPLALLLRVATGEKNAITGSPLLCCLRLRSMVTPTATIAVVSELHQTPPNFCHGRSSSTP